MDAAVFAVTATGIVGGDVNAQDRKNLCVTVAKVLLEGALAQIFGPGFGARIKAFVCGTT